MNKGEDSSNKRVRTFCLVIACLPDGKRNEDGYLIDDRGLPVVNGIIYDPESAYDVYHPNSRTVVDRFLNQFKGNEVKRVMITAELEPEELADELVDIFGIETGATYIRGITALFSATNEQAERICDELNKNPDMFNQSAQE